jgi:hypothetical protein
MLSVFLQEELLQAVMGMGQLFIEMTLNGLLIFKEERQLNGKIKGYKKNSIKDQPECR